MVDYANPSPEIVIVKDGKFVSSQVHFLLLRVKFPLLLYYLSNRNLNTIYSLQMLKDVAIVLQGKAIPALLMHHPHLNVRTYSKPAAKIMVR